jgi:hypothetical protein
MKKNILTEEKLKKIINESVIEYLIENNFDEGIGHKLGSLWQKGLNKFNNFKKDWEAGRRVERGKNLDYDGFKSGGYDEETINNVRSLTANAYRNERNNKSWEKKGQARQYNGGGGEYASQSGVGEENPYLGNNNGNNQQQTQSSQANPTQQTNNGTNPLNSFVNNPMFQNMSQSAKEKFITDELNKKGLVQKNGQWSRPGGKLTPQDRQLIQMWTRFKLNEGKDNDLDYSHFAVNKRTNLIVNGWNYSDIENSELRQFKKDRFEVDLIDMDFNPKDYKILTKKACIRQGINPDDIEHCWSNRGEEPTYIECQNNK